MAVTTIPSPAECRAYWEELRAPPILRRHLEAVARAAVEIARQGRSRGVDVDVALVEAAALLHDVGRTRQQGAQHGALGAQMVLAKGWPPRLARAVACHVGGGLDADDLRALGLPPPAEGDYMPRTLEEKIVCFADKLIGLDERQPLEAEFTKLRRRKLERAVVRIQTLREDLRRALGFDPAQV